MVQTKKVLWISRHALSDEQQMDLERALRAPVQVVPWTDTVKDMEDLRPALDQADSGRQIKFFRLGVNLLSRTKYFLRCTKFAPVYLKVYFTFPSIWFKILAILPQFCYSNGVHHRVS